MRVVKCPNCGAYSNKKNENGVVVCEYCNSPLRGDESVVNEPKNISYAYDYDEDDIKEFEEEMNGPRPIISIFWLIVLFWINIFVGLVYIGIMKHKQHEWDKNNY